MAAYVTTWARDEALEQEYDRLADMERGCIHQNFLFLHDCLCHTTHGLEDTSSHYFGTVTLENTFLWVIKEQDRVGFVS